LIQEIASDVYIEEQYPGVILGVISLPHGLVQIDAPPSPEDGRSWRASLLNLNSASERILVNLDAHPDRTLGVRAMECTVIAHEKTVQAFRNRPNTFKAQGDETGADWESVSGIGSVRWSLPEISFTNRMTVEWNDQQVVLEHHPGPTPGASWVIVPGPKVVFVGDLVLKDQPPFIAFCNLTEWLESLDVLLTKYKDYTVVSGRSGIVSQAVVRAQRELLVSIEEKLDALAQKRAGAEALEPVCQELLATIKAPADRQKQFARRLIYGLRHYYLRRYHLTGAVDTSEE
jgi:glyoxylase-like metal-dependent hydrolase (beta-lactamase superfamily II)